MRSGTVEHATCCSQQVGWLLSAQDRRQRGPDHLVRRQSLRGTSFDFRILLASSLFLHPLVRGSWGTRQDTWLGFVVPLLAAPLLTDFGRATVGPGTREDWNFMSSVKSRMRRTLATSSAEAVSRESVRLRDSNVQGLLGMDWPRPSSTHSPCRRTLFHIAMLKWSLQDEAAQDDKAMEKSKTDKGTHHSLEGRESRSCTG